jgi:hypothetical protein
MQFILSIRFFYALYAFQNPERGFYASSIEVLLEYVEMELVDNFLSLEK